MSTQPSEHAMRAANELGCGSAEARIIHGRIIDQHAIAPAVAEIKKELLEEARLNGKGSEREAKLLAQVAERDRRIAELESHLRALHIVALVGTESEHIFDAVTAFLAKSERSAP